MSIRRLDRSEWHGFCARISRQVIGKRADIETLSLQIGMQVAVLRVPILGIVYDPCSDVIEIILTHLEYRINHPREFYVDDTPEGPSSFQVVDADGARQIIVLSDPLMLPALTARS